MLRKSEDVDDVKWDSFVIEANEFLEAGGAGEVEQVAQMLLETGNNDENTRSNAINSIKALFKGLPGNPFGRRGQKSSIPAAVRVTIDTALQTVEEASIAFYNYDEVIAAVTRPHGRSGETHFADADAYAASVVKRTKTQLEKLYKEGDWDGVNIDALMPTAEEVSED